MQHTLVAVFDNRSDAQNAMDELLGAGFARSDVNVSSADPTGATDSLTGASPQVDESHEHGIAASIRHFFTGLFGADNAEHTQRYSDAVNRGHHVLTFVTGSEPEVERAADIIERFGPVDIDERHDLDGSASSLDPSMLAAGASAGSNLRQSGASLSAQSGAAGSLGTDSGSLGVASANVGSGSPGSMQGTQPGALQAGVDDDRNFYQMQNINDPVPMGTTFQEPMGGNLQGGSALDTSLGANDLNAGLPNSQQTSQGGSLSQGDPALQGTASMQGSNDASLGGTARLAGGSLQGGGQSGSLQRDTGKIGKVRVLSRDSDTGIPGLSGNDDSDWRGDWDRNYSSLGGSYDDYAPAYRYGNQMRSSDKYRDRSWDEVESDLRTDWNARNQGASTWDKFKAAVRRGWDKITPDIDDDRYYRSHWNAKYSNSSDSDFDDFQPAYLYGEEARRDQHFRDRDWSDAEADLRSRWDARRASEPSTWDKFKDAVRHGWDKITPDMDDSDSVYRSHYDSAYANSGLDYDALAPSYRFGNEMRNSDTYRNRNWDEAEPALQTEWQKQHGDTSASAWERVKAAVRHSWDKVTPDTDVDSIDNDSFYRNHWSSTYGASGDAYQDYEPAYRYGNEMRGSDKYRGRNWDDVETDLRSDWDTRYTTAGASTWDKMKAAVRRGWDRVTD